MNSANLSTMFSGMSAASGAASGVAQYKQGQVQRAAYDYNANVATEKMKEDVVASQTSFDRLMGKQRSLYAKAGVSISSGSPLLILADTAMQAQKDQDRIRASGTAAADMQRFYGEQAEFAGETGGISTFLTSLSKASMGYTMGQKGLGYTYGL
jgi:hypothetical protein